ncbi:hypothetical protein TCON_2054 [Astathelohania contejeani]|uniref:Uncharacterized protein n=1 Tax=Astathelohania contejeani TaxID=164912 RepID=A0ABQ7HX42_9MICR|nr:hypothetical protein TCON_2054 [Thelohania contejeani]
MKYCPIQILILIILFIEFALSCCLSCDNNSDSSCQAECENGQERKTLCNFFRKNCCCCKKTRNNKKIEGVSSDADNGQKNFTSRLKSLFIRKQTEKNDENMVSCNNIEQLQANNSQCDHFSNNKVNNAISGIREISIQTDPSASDHFSSINVEKEDKEVETEPLRYVSKLVIVKKYITVPKNSINDSKRQLIIENANRSSEYNDICTSCGTKIRMTDKVDSDYNIEWEVEKYKSKPQLAKKPIETYSLKDMNFLKAIKTTENKDVGRSNSLVEYIFQYKPSDDSLHNMQPECESILSRFDNQISTEKSKTTQQGEPIIKCDISNPNILRRYSNWCDFRQNKISRTRNASELQATDTTYPNKKIYKLENIKQSSRSNLYDSLVPSLCEKSKKKIVNPYEKSLDSQDKMLRTHKYNYQNVGNKYYCRNLLSTSVQNKSQENPISSFYLPQCGLSENVVTVKNKEISENCNEEKRIVSLMSNSNKAPPACNKHRLNTKKSGIVNDEHNRNNFIIATQDGNLTHFFNASLSPPHMDESVEISFHKFDKKLDANRNPYLNSKSQEKCLYTPSNIHHEKDTVYRNKEYMSNQLQTNPLFSQLKTKEINSLYNERDLIKLQRSMKNNKKKKVFNISEQSKQNNNFKIQKRLNSTSEVRKKNDSKNKSKQKMKEKDDNNIIDNEIVQRDVFHGFFRPKLSV